MLYQLKNGGTIQIPTEKFLAMSDEELDALEENFAYEVNDPFHDSVLDEIPPTATLDDFELPEIEELPEDFDEKE